jgi:hypothetical protein
MIDPLAIDDENENGRLARSHGYCYVPPRATASLPGRDDTISARLFCLLLIATTILGALAAWLT